MASQTDSMGTPSRRHSAGVPLIVVALMGVVCSLAKAQGGAADELSPLYRLGGIISKLPGYVRDWPDPDGKTVTIGFFGSHPASKLVAKLVEDQPVGGRPIGVRTVTKQEEVLACDILFVPASSQTKWNTLRSKMNTDRILTVGEDESFASLGGILVISTENDGTTTLSYSRSNYERSKSQGLKISSKLLRIAKRIE